VSASLRVQLGRAWRQASTPLRPEEPNYRLLYREVAWMGITNAIAGTFTGVFAVRLGASNQLLGLLVSLPALIGIFWQLPAARMVERQRRRLPIMLMAFLLTRLGYLVTAILPWLLHLWRPQALVALVVLMAVPGTVANIGFTSMMADVVAPHRRATVVNTRNMLLSFTTTVTALATGRLLDLFPFPINYQGAFLIGFAASMLSLINLARIRYAGEESVQTTTPRPTVPWRTILSNRHFVLFVLAFVAINFGLSMPSALYTIYRVRTMHSSDTIIGLISTIEVGTVVFSAPWWGRRAPRISNGMLVIIGSLGWSLYPICTALARRPEALLPVATISGLFNPPYTIGQFNLLMELCPEEGRPAYIGLYNAAINAAAFIAPLFGTTLADSVGIHTALLLSTLVRWGMTGLFVLWLWSQGQMNWKKGLVSGRIGRPAPRR